MFFLGRNKLIMMDPLKQIYIQMMYLIKIKILDLT